MIAFAIGMLCGALTLIVLAGCVRSGQLSREEEKRDEELR